MGLKRYFEMRAVATFYQIIFVVVVLAAWLVHNHFAKLDNIDKSIDNEQFEENLN
ncbi:hypothetical protein BH09BAC1_BH09BAC1_20410 [soil metagenome]